MPETYGLYDSHQIREIVTAKYIDNLIRVGFTIFYSKLVFPLLRR